jgi:Icc-related predicted phosphoesterase
VIRLAAVGDIHAGVGSRGQVAAMLAGVDQHADALLIAGDLTRHGLVEEAQVLADDLRSVHVPVAVVLGNHDWHSGRQDDIARVMASIGVRVLEGTSVQMTVGDHVLGVAGTKGFGGGFAGATIADFGEPQMRAFAAHARESAAGLAAALAGITTCDVRVALTHYAPVAETLLGEPMEIYPFLGSHLLADVIDEARPSLALHGHAHHGIERGTTAGGVPVRNVATTVLRRPYAVYQVAPVAVPSLVS